MLGRKLRSVLDMLNSNVIERAPQEAQKFLHDNTANSRNFILGDNVTIWFATIVVRDHHGLWEQLWICQVQKYCVDFTFSGQFVTWRHHTDQLKKCFEEAEPQPADTSAVLEGEEEDTPSVTDPNVSESSEQPSSDVNRQSVDSNNLLKKNPPRNHKPPVKLIYQGKRRCTVVTKIM